MYRSIKILYRISGILAAICFLPWFMIADTYYLPSVEGSFWQFCILISALLVPGGFLFLAIALKKLYKELSSDKLSTISMITDLKKELEDLRKEVKETKSE